MPSHYPLIFILIHVLGFDNGRREMSVSLGSVRMHTHTYSFLHLIKLSESQQFPVLENLLYRHVFGLTMTF